MLFWLWWDGFADGFVQIRVRLVLPRSVWLSDTGLAVQFTTRRLVCSISGYPSSFHRYKMTVLVEVSFNLTLLNLVASDGRKTGRIRKSVVSCFRRA
jgi:hypothetical protein